MRLRKPDLKKLKKEIGAGVITGGADNDPAGIVTHTTVGAMFGYALLWVVILCIPLLVVIQEMAARVAIVKRKGLSSIIKEHFGERIAVFAMTVLLIANIATIGADIAGVAAVIGLITNTNWLIYVIPVTAAIGYLVLFKKYRFIRRLLLALTAILIVYIISAFFSAPDISGIVLGFVPSFLPSMAFVLAVTGIIGTTISPYLLFWQASDELEEHKTILRPKEIEADTIIGMTWSNVVAIFIIIAAAATLFQAGIVPETAEQAALALKPIAGQWAYLLFTLGIIFSGFLALPVLAGSTAYAVAETFGWREGLNKTVFSAKGFYFVFMLSLIIGSSLALLPINPIHFLFYTQVLDGFLTPFLAVILLFLCNSKKIMGNYTNGKVKNLIAVLLVLILIFFDAILIAQLFGLV